MAMDEFGTRVRRLREEKGWHQSDLARAASVSKSFISEMETGSSKPRGPILVRIARALGASLDFLLTGEAAMAPMAEPVRIPPELDSAAQRLGMPYAHVRLLLKFWSQIEGRRHAPGDKTLSEPDWADFYKKVLPFIEKGAAGRSETEEDS